MTSGIVFILHGPADASYAAELAGALSPHLAFPVALSADARTTQYGAGAVCVVLWTQDASARAMADIVAEAMPDTMTSAVICRIGDARLPASLAANATLQVHAHTAARDAAAPLLEAIARKQQDLAARSARPRRAVAPALGNAAHRPVAREADKHRMVVRSAWGFAATMAVAGVVAPMVGGRAGAANITPDQSVPPPEAATTNAAATEVAPELDSTGEVVPAAHTPVLQPPRDTLEALIQPPLEPAVSFAREDDVLAVDEQMTAEIVFDASELDTKTSEIIAGMVAGAGVGEWKIEAIAPAPVAQRGKPAVSRDASKPGSGV